MEPPIHKPTCPPKKGNQKLSVAKLFVIFKFIVNLSIVFRNQIVSLFFHSKIVVNLILVIKILKLRKRITTRFRLYTFLERPEPLLVSGKTGTNSIFEKTRKNASFWVDQNQLKFLGRPEPLLISG